MRSEKKRTHIHIHSVVHTLKLNGKIICRVVRVGTNTQRSYITGILIVYASIGTIDEHSERSHCVL